MLLLRDLHVPDEAGRDRIDGTHEQPTRSQGHQQQRKVGPALPHHQGGSELRDQPHQYSKDKQASGTQIARSRNEGAPARSLAQETLNPGGRQAGRHPGDHRNGEKGQRNEDPAVERDAEERLFDQRRGEKLLHPGNLRVLLWELTKLLDRFGREQPDRRLLAPLDTVEQDFEHALPVLDLAKRLAVQRQPVVRVAGGTPAH